MFNRFITFGKNRPTPTVGTQQTIMFLPQGYPGDWWNGRDAKHKNYQVAVEANCWDSEGRPRIDHRLKFVFYGEAATPEFVQTLKEHINYALDDVTELLEKDGRGRQRKDLHV